MIVEHPDVPPARILAAVREEWGIDADSVERLELSREGWHWLVGDGDGPQWIASIDLDTAAEHRQRAAAFECAAMLRQELGFVLAPVYTRDARIAVELPAGLAAPPGPRAGCRTRGPRAPARRGPVLGRSVVGADGPAARAGP